MTKSDVQSDALENIAIREPKYKVFPKAREAIEHGANLVMSVGGVPYNVQEFLTKPVSEAYRDTMEALQGMSREAAIKYLSTMEKLHSTLADKLTGMSMKLDQNGAPVQITNKPLALLAVNARSHQGMYQRLADNLYQR